MTLETIGPAGDTASLAYPPRQPDTTAQPVEEHSFDTTPRDTTFPKGRSWVEKSKEA